MAGTWAAIPSPPAVASGSFSADTMILLTDGSVLVHNAYGKEWLRFNPDSFGKYETGSWSVEIDMANTRQFFASGVLKDGRVFAIGGEYSDAGSDTPLGEIFDPRGGPAGVNGPIGAWSPMSAADKPPEFDWIQGDASSCVLDDGRVLIGAINSAQTALWDPANRTWTEAGTKSGTVVSTKDSNSDEETWTLLPDRTVLTVEIKPSAINRAEKYLPDTDEWVSAGATPQPLVLSSITDPVTGANINVSEIGPAVLLPSGQLFAIGATGHSAIYTPPSGDSSQPGSWSPGPDFPPDSSATPLLALNTAIDAPCCLLPGGKVLCVSGATVRELDEKGVPSFWSNPTTFFLYDPASNVPTLPQLAAQLANNTDTWTARFLLLPTGQVLFSNQLPQMSIYTPDPSADGQPDPSWAPAVTAFPAVMKKGTAQTLSGTQFNGVSQACSYGDDAQMATNYPIVRISNSSGQVIYLFTTNFSTLGVATGNTVVTVDVEVPGTVASGAWTLEVVANGIASNPCTVQIVD